ncbi:MAG: hypothetical protein ACRC62_02510 [Microcoleus sp.]
MLLLVCYIFVIPEMWQYFSFVMAGFTLAKIHQNGADLKFSLHLLAVKAFERKNIGAIDRLLKYDRL